MKPYATVGGCTIYNADALDLLRSLTDASVDLIATDPPYFRVKGAAWDRAWKNDREFLRWFGLLCREWRRVLKPNGSLYVFASPQMAHGVERVVRRHFRVLTNIRWRKPPFSTKAEMFDKEDLRAPFPASETIIFAEQRGSDDSARDAAGYDAQCEVVKRQVFGDYMRAEIQRAGSTSKAVAALFPSRTGGFTGCVSNWLLGLNCPTREQYAEIRRFLNARGGEYLRREYEYLRRRYEDLRRPFFGDASRPYTDVWDYPTVGTYAGKHECEKPLAMMEHIIQTSSRPGAVVLDTFSGSGTTARAAENLGRLSIMGDADPHWCAYTADRLSQASLFSEAA